MRTREDTVVDMIKHVREPSKYAMPGEVALLSAEEYEDLRSEVRARTDTEDSENRACLNFFYHDLNRFVPQHFHNKPSKIREAADLIRELRKVGIGEHEILEKFES